MPLWCLVYVQDAESCGSYSQSWNTNFQLEKVHNVYFCVWIYLNSSCAGVQSLGCLKTCSISRGSKRTAFTFSYSWPSLSPPMALRPCRGGWQAWALAKAGECLGSLATAHCLQNLQQEVDDRFFYIWNWCALVSAFYFLSTFQSPHLAVSRLTWTSLWRSG